MGKTFKWYCSIHISIGNFGNTKHNGGVSAKLRYYHSYLQQHKELKEAKAEAQAGGLKEVQILLLRQELKVS